MDHPYILLVLHANQSLIVSSNRSFIRPMQVLEIIALRKNGLRGQAFVLFEDVQAATAALQAEQGFTFFGKDLKLAYAKEKSDRIAKRDGTYVPRAKRRKKAAEASSTSADAAAGASTGAASAAGTSETAPPVPTGDDAAASVTPSTPQQQPTHILFAESLPSECNEMMLAMLFRQVRILRGNEIQRRTLELAIVIVIWLRMFTA